MIPSMLQRYVLRETVRVGLVSLAALTAIIFVGMGLSLVRQGLSVVQLRGVFRYLVTFSLPYALPTALLVTSVFVFGRLSGANEITAIRSSGVNLNHIILPLLVIAVLVSSGTFWLSHYMLPWSLARVKEQRERLISTVLKEARHVQKLYHVGAYDIYVGGMDEGNRFWKDVAVIQFADDEFPAKVMIAKRAHCQVDEERDVAKLILYNGTLMEPELDNIGGLEESGMLRFDRMENEIPLWTARKIASDRPKYLVFPALRKRMRQLRRSAAKIRSEDRALANLAHPKTERKLAERKADAAYRKCQRIKVELDAGKRVADDARERVEKTQEKVRVAQAKYDATAQQHDDAATSLAEHKPHLEELQGEIRKLIEHKAEPERIKRRQEELRDVAVRVNRLSAKVAEAKLELEYTGRTLKAFKKKLAAGQEALDEALADAASVQAEVDAAWAVFEASKLRVSRVRVLESLLRAETAFHFRNAGAVTSIVFVLIGIPLGIFSRRGSVIMAFALSFFAVLIVYYPLMMVAKMLSLDGYVGAAVAQWMPNVLVGGTGTALLAGGIRR